jgi:hypothetical protein
MLAATKHSTTNLHDEFFETHGGHDGRWWVAPNVRGRKVNAKRV